VAYQEIREFETALGFELPEDYRNFLKTINGGEVFIEHNIIPYGFNVNALYRLSASNPFYGLDEARRIQVQNKLCLRQALIIGDDGGTGEYLLALDGKRKGAVFFIWLDDRPILTTSEWENDEVIIPEEMIEISSSFNYFGELILKGAERV
jgi:hypothetical protein